MLLIQSLRVVNIADIVNPWRAYDLKFSYNTPCSGKKLSNKIVFGFQRRVKLPTKPLESRAIILLYFQHLEKIESSIELRHLVSCSIRISRISVITLFRKSLCLLLQLIPLIFHEIIFIERCEERWVDTYM